MHTLHVRFSALIVMLAMLVTACDAYGPKPAPAQSPTPKPTVAPEATVGPLTSVTIEKPALTMLSPSTWKAPVALNDNGVVLSATGTNDTSSTAGPFLLVIVDQSEYFHSRLSFPPGFTDPVEQLNAMIDALNRDGPQFEPASIYVGSKYPAAITRGFERDNEQTIVLMNAGNDRWIYVGAQSREVTFPYYEGAVFIPATNSITLTSP